MISEALIELLALKHAPPVHPDYVDCDDWHDFARAIEREALKEVKVQIPTNTMEQEFAWRQRKGFVAGYKQGQERMRERATSQAAEEAGEHGTDSDGWYICKSLSHQIEELEIEEPK